MSFRDSVVERRNTVFEFRRHVLKSPTRCSKATFSAAHFVTWLSVKQRARLVFAPIKDFYELGSPYLIWRTLPSRRKLHVSRFAKRLLFHSCTWCWRRRKVAEKQRKWIPTTPNLWRRNSLAVSAPAFHVLFTWGTPAKCTQDKDLCAVHCAVRCSTPCLALRSWQPFKMPLLRTKGCNDWHFHFFALMRNRLLHDQMADEDRSEPLGYNTFVPYDSPNFPQSWQPLGWKLLLSVLSSGYVWTGTIFAT